MTEIRIILNEKDFADLVHGRVVRKLDSPVSIMLSDIGFDRMYIQIERARLDIEK